MFNTLSIEAITCTVRRGSFKFQDTFCKNISEFRIDLSRLFYSIFTERKKRVFEEIVFKMKKGYISRPSCVVRSSKR